jgi:glucose-1-phosphate thymidylyltransferase
LEIKAKEPMIHGSAKVQNSVIIPPCFIGDGAVIKDSIIGPYVSVGKGTKIKHSVITNSVIGEQTVIKDSNLGNSMVGNFVEYIGRKSELSISDYSKFSS